MAEQSRQTEAFRSGVTLGIIENATRNADRKPGRIPVENASRNTHKGYLDTRLFQIMQAWEFVANSWGPRGCLSPEEKDLKQRVKATCKEWRKDHKGIDPDGQWADRIQFAFRWPKVKDAISRYTSSLGVNLASLGVDLERLKCARDSVAHTGKLPEGFVSDKQETLDLLIRAQNAMQLVLLSELGYQGKVSSRSLRERVIRDLPMPQEG